MDEKSEIIAWKKEFRRYVWENVTPAASTNLIPIASTQTRAKSSNKSILDRVKGLGVFLRSRFPSAELLPKDLSISQATFNEANFTSNITAKFTLNKKQINSCGMIHNAVLAAFFDAIGRMVLPAAGRCVVNCYMGLDVVSSFVATAGDQIHVTGSMVWERLPEGYCTTVRMEISDGTFVADGSFRAWKVRETEDGEAYDNMI